MPTFTRDVSLLSKFDKHSNAEQIIYVPGNLNPNTVTPGVDYSGLVKNLVLIAELDYYQTIQFWIDDVDGNRYLLDNEIKLRTTTKPINLLEEVFSSNEISIAPGNKLGMTVLFPNNFVKSTNDFVTIFGFVTETAQQEDEAANQTALALIGVELGIAPLDSDGVVPIAHLPSWQELPGLETSLNGKQPLGDYAPNVHEHGIANVTGLQDALDFKQPSGNYALDNHSHQTLGETLPNGRKPIETPESQPGFFGSVVINGKASEWHGIASYQPSNPLGSNWSFMLNYPGTSNNYQGVFNQSANTWYWRFINGALHCQSVVTSSDIRLKDDIHSIENPVLPGLVELNLFKFKWKGESDGRHKYGLSAQQLQEFFPELITSLDDGFGGESTLSVDWSQLGILVLKGLQELAAKIDSL
jgi:hypothetical protein